MAYISSSKIEVFPTTKRSGDYKSNRLMSEANLVRLVNQLLDTKSFVISNEFSITATSSFEFNIAGYYFKIDKQSDMASVITALSNPTNVYANITLTGTAPWLELSGQDASGEYQGVTFSSAASTGTNVYSLKILTKTDDTYGIPDESKVKFDLSKMTGSVLEVDGGTL